MFEETKLTPKLIQNISKLSSQEDLWRTFNEILEGTPFHRWYYMSYQRLSGNEGIKPVAGFDKGQCIDMQGCDLPSEMRPRIIHTFRGITHPCYIEDIPSQIIISNETLSKIRQIIKINEEETMLLVPTFGAGFNKGYFLLIADKAAEKPSTDESVTLSMECQLTHTHYTSLTASEHKDRLRFSSREKKILEFVAEGFSNFEISKELSLSPHIINIYLKVIFKKTNSQNRTTAALNGIALGLIH